MYLWTSLWSWTRKSNMKTILVRRLIISLRGKKSPQTLRCFTFFKNVLSKTCQIIIGSAVVFGKVAMSNAQSKKITKWVQIIHQHSLTVTDYLRVILVMTVFRFNSSKPPPPLLVKHRCVGETFHNRPSLGQHHTCRKGHIAQRPQRRAFLPPLSQRSHLSAVLCYIIINS